MRTKGTTLAAAAAAIICQTVTAGDWPQFRGPTGQGIASVANLPVEWSATRNCPWKVEVPGEGWSSPILYRERIYLTTAVATDGGEISLRALCLDSHTGKTFWNTEVFRVTPTKGHAKNSHASPTPIADGDRLYVHFGHYGTAALDLNGGVRWRNSSLSYSSLHGNGGSPTLSGSALIFHGDGTSNPFIAALHKETGELLWKTARNSGSKRTFSFSTPLVIEVDGRPQVISPASGAVMAYDPQTGRELWRVRYGAGYSLVPRPVFGHGLLFVATGFDKANLMAIRPGGSGDVTETHVAWTITKGAPNTPSPLLVGDELYFISDGGIMTCADAKTGEVHWQERAGGNFSASPVFGDGKIFVQSEEGVGTVLRAGKTFEVLARNDLRERSLASYAVDEGVLYIRTAKNLYRIQQPIPAAARLEERRLADAAPGLSAGK